MPVVNDADFERMLAELFRKEGWHVRRHPGSAPLRANLLVNDGDHKYIVAVKVASEARRDRLIPLLAQAILQAQTFARKFPEPVAPLAIVAARRVPESIAEHLKKFAEQNAPDVAVGIVDSEGFRSFAGAGLEKFDARPARRAPADIISSQRSPDLFSDLNQWMLKILVGQHLPDSLICVPRGPFQSASQLAEVAKVSIMSASRLLNQLKSRGFVDGNAQNIQVVRIEELLDSWISSNREASKEVSARWIIKGGENQLFETVRKFNARHIHNQPRCCLGLFAAADALGLGFVRGVPAHIYLERLTLDSLHRLGLVIDDSRRAADVMVRIPSNPEAVFRPRVLHAGVPVSDVMQVWVDVSSHPARGREQAREIRRSALRPLFEKRS